MYIDLIKNFNVNDLISNDFEILAHIKSNDSSEDESLNSHIELCKKYFEKIVKDKNLNNIFINFENIFLKDKDESIKLVFRELLVNTIIFHDIGKINPNFQKRKMKNNLNIKDREIERIGTTEHSIYSSIIYIDYCLDKLIKLKNKKIIDKESFNIFLGVIILNSYIISRHHSGFNCINQYLSNLLDMFSKEKVDDIYCIINTIYFRKLKLKYKNIEKMIEKYKNLYSNIKESYKDIDSEIEIYTYVRFILSILIACDYYATSEYMSGTKINDIGKIDDINKFYNDFKNGEIYNKIREYEKEKYGKGKDFSKVKDINILRTEMFLDSEKELEKNIEKNIFYLEAPTGSGKSNTANNLAFKLIEKDKNLNKIFYVYPFNTLVEQNINIFKKIYKKNKDALNDISVINSLYPIKVQNNKEVKEDEEQAFENFEKALLNRQFLNYPMILTTHVTLFSYMFGTRKEDVFPFHQLSNSVIILDEIQSYKNKIWREIIEFLNGFSKILNIKIIIMSATLPSLDELIVGKSLSIPLIKDREKYFNNKLFKDRVKVNFDLIRGEKNIKKEDVFNDLIEKIKEYKDKKILVEFIKKKSAYEFFKELKERKELGEIESEVRLLTGDDNSVEREKIINEIKGNKEKGIEGLKDVILVATQVIEAGVDIDMDIGFKDYSIFDSEEQFLGRINRSCLKEESIVYFFKLDVAGAIYKEDVRNHDDVTLKNKEIRKILITKEFPKYFKKINIKIFNNTSGYNELNTINFFKDEVGNLNFKEVQEKMKLIDDDKNDIQVFLNYKVEIEKEDGEIETIFGNDIWEEYKNLLMDNSMDFAKKKVELSEVKAKMNYFIYRIKTKESFNYNDRIGELLYIDNGDDYFIDGKLNKEKFESNVGEFI